jgi:transcriptional regulator with XRE-family HTH domain
MPTRMSAVDAAARRAQLQLDNVIGDLVNARHKAGLPQRRVARALGVSRSLVAAWEVRRVVPTHTQLSQWGAAVGLDVSLRTFLGGPPLRDAGQLRILSRLHVALGATWTWRTEVPISRNPADRRAMDAVLSRDDRRVGVEAVSRLTDAEGQIRPILLKQQAAGIECVVLVLADSRHNRQALAASGPTVQAAFPCPPRVALAALRRGELPPANAAILI